jgi:hypothetical protein
MVRKSEEGMGEVLELIVEVSIFLLEAVDSTL